MTVTEPVSSSSTQHRLAGVLATLGAALLGVRAVRTLGPDPYGTLEPLAGVAVGTVALIALGAAAAAFQSLGSARVLIAGALIGSLLVEWLPTAPPRLLHLLPMSLATGLLLVPGASWGVGRAARRASKAAGGETCVHHPPPWATVLGWLGLAMHAAVGYLYLLSGLVAPWYGVLFLWALWGFLLFVGLHLRARRPALVPAVALLTAVSWYATMLFGDYALGWVA